MAMTGLAGCGSEEGSERTREAGRAAATKVVTDTVTRDPSPKTTVTRTERRTVEPREEERPEPERNAYELPPDASFVDAYEAAGIEAPAGWAHTTADQVCAAWAQGRDTGYTDRILSDGGIYDSHLRDFSDIIEMYFCPGLQP
ncbi:hypothetical protein [Actinomadura sp. 9N407]|uniref:hypothetical protein n=1 Tax=Actinomadura sp. 9N407 TaxID=3375154 RepID=UPI0037A1A0EE